MLWFWFLNTGNFGIRLPPGCVKPLCHRMTGVSKMYAANQVSWYVASMLCCHCWMFSLSDALPMQSYPSNVWVLCQCGRATQLICLVSYRSMLLHEIGGISCWLNSCGMFSLLVEYGLVHRGDCINCETCYFCFDPAFVWPSLGLSLIHISEPTRRA